VKKAVFLLFLLPACSVIVQSRDSRIRCEITTTDPCPSGSHCIDHFCTQPVCTEDETGCNEVDDDCDGRIDEGSDNDMDGFQWCATNPTLRDCRDDNAMIHPAGAGIPAPEDRPCDGADNDCDGLATECVGAGLGCDQNGECRQLDCTFAFQCPPMNRCNTAVMPAQCVAITGSDCTVTPCSPPLVCDPLERTCITPHELGEGCGADEQCASSLCVSREALGLQSGDVGGASQVCTQLCCSDANCPSGSVCWAPGTGARGCVPLSILGLGNPGAPTSESCSTSLDCEIECALHSAPAYNNSSRRAFTCGAPVGASTFDCNASSECRSGLCTWFCSIGCYTACSTPCGSTADCDAFDVCGWIQLSDLSYVQSCVGGGPGSGSGAAPCSGESDCRDEACLTGTSGSYCADTCCSDLDCASGYSCRPTRNHGRWEMLCVEG
jgi:hypothetical protein